MFIKKSVKIFVLVVLVLALSGFTYAFAAANTVPATKAGDGSGAISGYTITNVKYNLDGTDPSAIDNVTFTLDAAATSANIRLVAGGTWYSCTIAGGTAVTCNTLDAPVSTALLLQVVAAN